MASAEEALRSTNAKANFQRLTRLLMRGGVVLLKETFDSIHSPTNLPTILGNPAVKTRLRSAKLSRVEWNCLYPSPGLYGKSTDFDITLTFRLLRTICNLIPPATGWDSLPSSTDHTLEADLARVKYYRNEVYGHSSTMDISDAEFDDLWREISEALLRIAAGISHDKGDEWKEAIDKCLNDPLTPDEERCVEELSQWYKYDLDVKDAVEKLEESLRGLLEEELQSIREDMRQHFVEIAIRLEANPVSFHHPYLHQGASGSEEMCSVPIASEHEQEAEARSLPREPQEIQQNLPSDIDIWNVVLSFKNSFDLFFKYFKEKLNVFVRRLDVGSLLITVECSSLEILEGLWKDYKSGNLTQVAQETLITAEVLEKLELAEVRLKTIIAEEEYENGRHTFLGNPDHGGLAKVGDAAYGRKPGIVSSFDTYGSSVEKLVSMLDIEDDGSLETVFNKIEKQQSEDEEREISKTISGFEGKHVRSSSFEGQIQTRWFRPVLSFGELGESVGKLDSPWGVAVNNRNEIAVTEFNNHRVSVFSSDGTHLRSFGRRGCNKGEFNYPTGIAFGNNGNIIVADCDNNRVQVFGRNGEFLTKFGDKGNLDHQLQNPEGLSVTSNGDIIVADRGNKLIKIFSPRGHFKCKFGGQGSLSLPFHCIQTEPFFIVSDSGEHCIKVFDLEVGLAFKFGKKGSKEGEFNRPGYLSVNRDGHLMVCDSWNHRVQVFELSGKFVTKFGTEGRGKGEFDWPVSTANLSDGRIVVCDWLNHRIQIFELICDISPVKEKKNIFRNSSICSVS